MRYLSSNNYSMTTPTTASPPGATSLQLHDHTATLVRSARVIKRNLCKQPQSETGLRTGARLLAFPSTVPTLWRSVRHALSLKQQLQHDNSHDRLALRGNLPAASRPHGHVGPLCQGSLKQTNQSQNKWRLTQPQTRFPHDPIEMGYLTNPLKHLGFQTPPHLTPMIVPKPTINASPSCAVKFCLWNGISPPIKRLAENHATKHTALATLAQWRDRRVRGAKPASAAALQTNADVAFLLIWRRWLYVQVSLT
jgi:hypothetical protein